MTNIIEIYSLDMEDRYTTEELHADMEMLRKAGLIEVTGVNPEGDWLWSATAKSLEMTPEQIEFLIMQQEDIDNDG
jgi:hypothetical protein